MFALCLNWKVELEERSRSRNLSVNDTNKQAHEKMITIRTADGKQGRLMEYIIEWNIQQKKWQIDQRSMWQKV